MRLEEREYELLELPEFQRLRYIKQTGLGFLVYPGAVHTIFDHVLGSLCLAKKHIRRFEIDGEEKEKKVLFVSILLRDVGSEPLRHVFWDVRDRIPKEKQLPIHESVRIVEQSKKIGTILSSMGLKVDEICKILQEPSKDRGAVIKWFHKLQPLVDGPLSFNRLDYYLRDAYYAGIKGIGFDPSEIFNNATFHKEKGLVYKEEAIPSIENVLLLRVNLYSKLYSNPEAIKGQKMLARVMERFIGDDYDKFYAFRRETIEQFQSDDEFIHRLREKIKNDEVAQRIVQLIETGQLYGTLDHIYRWPKLPDETKRRLEWYIDHPIDWKNHEREVNSKLSAEFGQIIVDFDKPTIEGLVKNIFVSKDGDLERIDKASPLIGSLEEDKGDRYGITELEKRNWFLGVYYDRDKIRQLGIDEDGVKKQVENVFDIRLSER